MLLGQLKRRERRHGCGQRSRKKRTYRGGGCRRRPGKCICNKIGEARDVLHGKGKLREKGKLALLPSKFRRREAVEHSCKRFVVSDEEE